MDHGQRKDFAFLTLAGQSVSVQVNDGSIWEGIFVAADDTASEGILLYAAVRVPTDDYDGSQSANYTEKAFIPMENIMSISAIDIKMQTGNIATAKVAPARAAPLPQKPAAMNWDETVDDTDLEAEEKNWHQGQFNQFEANAKLGVKSDYDENLYTTKLDDSTFTAEQRSRAERIANEIMKSAATGGIQQRIERGEEVEIDEAELYTDVKRQEAPKKPVAPLSTGAAGSYVPPSKRAAAATTAPTITPQQPTPAGVPANEAPIQAPPQPSPEPAPQTGPSLGASASETPKTQGSGLRVTAKAWVPPSVSAVLPIPAPAPPLDFATAFTNLALKLIANPGTFNRGPDTEWFPDNNIPLNLNHQMGGGYSTGYRNPNDYNMGGNQQGGYGRGGYAPRGRGNYNPQQPNVPRGGMMNGGVAGMGMGGMGMGGMGGGMQGGMGAHNQQPMTINPPQPLDSDGIPSRAGPPAPVSQPEPVSAMESKPKMKRGRA